MLPINPNPNTSTTTLNTIKILHQILNRTNLDPPPLPKPQTPISPHHPIIAPNLSNTLHDLAILHQLRNNTHGPFPGKPTKLDGGFGVAFSFAHAAASRLEWYDVPGSPEVRGADARGRESAAGQGAVVCRYSRGD